MLWHGALHRNRNCISYKQRDNFICYNNLNISIHRLSNMRSVFEDMENMCYFSTNKRYANNKNKEKCPLRHQTLMNISFKGI